MRAILAMTVALTLLTGQLQADPPRHPPAQVFGALPDGILYIHELGLTKPDHGMHSGD